MIINYLGKQFFKISQGDLTIAFNPISKDSTLNNKVSRFGADISIVTTNHPDFNGSDGLGHGDRTPFIISGPGEYEVKEVFIKGLLSSGTIDGKKYINTIYLVNLDDIKICFLGAFDGDITSQAREEIGSPDILFVPIGGEGILDSSKAYKLAVSFEPSIIIPMDYGDDKEKNSLQIFLKNAGGENIKPIEKLVLKKKDLEGKEGEIIVLES